jgi:hypothetical protein
MVTLNTEINHPHRSLVGQKLRLEGFDTALDVEFRPTLLSSHFCTYNTSIMEHDLQVDGVFSAHGLSLSRRPDDEKMSAVDGTHHPRNQGSRLYHRAQQVDSFYLN